MPRFAQLLSLFSILLPGAETWTRLQSSNFELLTTANERRSREAILHFEQVRSFFLSVMKGTGTPLPVRIVAFSSEKEYKPYRPNEFASAYYLGGHDRDYIVMSGLGAERFPIAVHEYTHLLIRHSGLKVPVWFNEGLAELYSTMKPIAKKVQVGDIIPERHQLLFREKWLPVAALVAVDHASPLYNERDRAGMFYSASWALVHMLWLEERYRPHFGALAQALHKGGTSSEAFAKVFGKSLDQVDKDLQGYIRGQSFNAALFDVKLEKSAEQPEVSPAGALEVGMSLAHLRGGGKDDAQSRAAYEKLAEEHPSRPEPAEALGYLSLRFRDRDKAVEHLARAAELGSTNPKLYWDYALLLQSRPEQKTKLIAALEKTLALNPSHVEARLMLGHHLLGERDYKKALEHLGQIRSVTKEQAPSLFRALAYAALQSGEQERAISAARRLAETATSPEQKDEAEKLLHFVSQKPEEPRPVFVAREPEPVTSPEREEPPALKRRGQVDGDVAQVVSESSAFRKPQTIPMEGKLQQVDCLGKQARLVVTVNGKAVRFLIDDPQKVDIRGHDGLTVDFTCGPQKGATVLVEYMIEDNARLGTVGLVRGLEFKKN